MPIFVTLQTGSWFVDSRLPSTAYMRSFTVPHLLLTDRTDSFGHVCLDFALHCLPFAFLGCTGGAFVWLPTVGFFAPTNRFFLPCRFDIILEWMTDPALRSVYPSHLPTIPYLVLYTMLPLCIFVVLHLVGFRSDPFWFFMIALPCCTVIVMRLDWMGFTATCTTLNCQPSATSSCGLVGLRFPTVIILYTNPSSPPPQLFDCLLSAHIPHPHPLLPTRRIGSRFCACGLFSHSFLQLPLPYRPYYVLPHSIHVRFSYVLLYHLLFFCYLYYFVYILLPRFYILFLLFLP